MTITSLNEHIDLSIVVASLSFLYCAFLHSYFTCMYTDLKYDIEIYMDISACKFTWISELRFSKFDLQFFRFGKLF